ncbi:MAG TPA: helix-turn-helix domain-containing protein [Jatrophihabitans sp.]|nr:helix-turn-helix domain-containing protein [Jatrophihabitans sp.]
MAADPSTLAQLEGIVPSLRPIVPELIEDLAGQLRRLMPEYSQFLSERRAEVTVAAEGVVCTLVRIAEQILTQNSADDAVLAQAADPAIFEQIGRMQWRQGIPIGTLLAAYQLGARQTWRLISRQALLHDLPPEVLTALAESVFCFVDQLSSASAAGYLDEQSESAAAREQSRDELVELLLSDRSDSQAVRTAALRAGWRLPATAAVVLVSRQSEAGAAAISRLDQSCLRMRHGGLLGAIVPDPAAPGRRQRLAAALRGASATIGHSVTLAQLPGSARIAAIAARLQQEKVLTADPLFADEHLDAIIVHNDPRLLQALRRQCLQPLEGLPAGSQTSLRETLRSWLRNCGDRRATADELQVHPQTVRYRMARLRELFGDELDEPSYRLKLLLALAWDPA